jgi:mono/diheme cytochrome c family protein
MNTSKQINIMILVVFLSVVAGAAYTLWDPERASEAKDHQLEQTVNRGAYLFSQNCAACHGDAGEGGAAANRLREAPVLNILSKYAGDDYDEIAYANDYRFYYYTIVCGRLGRFMPAWGQSQGGPLNDEQIKQLTTFILRGGEEGWEQSQEYAYRGVEAFHIVGYDQFDLSLAEAVDESSDVLVLNHVTGEPPEEGAPAPQIVVPNDRLQIGEGSDVEEIFVVLPAVEVNLEEDVDVDGTEVVLDDASGLAEGDIFRIDSETLTVVSINGDSVTVTRDANEQNVTAHTAGTAVFIPSVQPNNNTVLVERGIGTTSPTAHEAGVEVFKPAIPPSDPVINERSCGATAGPAGPTPTPPPPSATMNIIAAGTAWNLPQLTGIAGVELTVNVDNQDEGVAHNFAVFNGGDSEAPLIAATDIENGPVQQTLTFGPLEAGTYFFTCEVHPGAMDGTLTVVAEGGTPAGQTPVPDTTPAPATPAP